jgi:hypothetical protein
VRPSDAHIWVWGIAELKMQNKLASFGHRKARIRPLELALKERYLAQVSFARKRASRPSLDQGGFEATHSQLICLDAIAAVMVWSKTLWFRPLHALETFVGCPEGRLDGQLDARARGHWPLGTET